MLFIYYYITIMDFNKKRQFFILIYIYARLLANPQLAGWPSGLRRCVQVAVYIVGAGSNPAPVTHF